MAVFRKLAGAFDIIEANELEVLEDDYITPKVNSISRCPLPRRFSGD